MITNVIEFDAKIDADWKISIPVEYRGYVSSSPKVILLLLAVLMPPPTQLNFLSTLANFGGRYPCVSYASN
jgi:hypothetical protein